MIRQNLAKSLLPPMELAILQILWATRQGSVQEIRDRLDDDPAYTTVQTILNKMERKGRVKRRLEGRTFIYSPALQKDKALAVACRDFLTRFFNGDMESLLAKLVETNELDEEALTRVEDLIQKKKAEVR